MNKQEILVSKYTKIIHPQDIGKETSVLENTLRNLIEEARQRERERIIEEIKRLEKSENSRDYNFGGESGQDRGHNEMRGMDNIFGYNQALQDIINHLK
jgi:hypothetical protein